MRALLVLSVLAVTVTLLTPTPTLAAGRGDSVRTKVNSTILFDGIQIDSVIIENRNIYDTDEEGYDKFIFKLANKLHLKTNRYIVNRELLLKKGDLFSTDLAEESSRNLRKNLKVYDAWIEAEALPNGNVLMKVVTIDEWSLTGGLNYSREGNVTRYKIGLEEENFLGNNQFLSFYYFAQSDDENFVETRFFDNRFLGKSYSLRLDLNNDPLNTVQRVALSRPFYDLQQKWAYAADVRKFSGRRDVYDDSIKIGESTFDGDVAQGSIAYRFGGYGEKLSLQLSHKYRFERNFDKQIFVNGNADSLMSIAGFSVDSLYHEIRLAANYSRFKYIKLHNIDGFKYTEDYILGYFAGLELRRAFLADFEGHHFDVAGASVSRYWSQGSDLILFDYGHTVWFRGNDMLRHFTTLRGKYYNRASRRVTLAFSAAYTSDWDQSGRNNLSLGGTTGIRGYDKFFRTGNRRLVFNAETRLYSDITILSAMFGGAVFVDLASIWKSGEPLEFDHTYASAGIGLRIAFEKSTKNIVRIDLAYSEATKWELSIGTNQYFFATK